MLTKLTSAVYKILDYFPESDPLKNKAKEKALAIMERPTAEDIDILIGYLEIAKSQRWLDSVNCLIVVAEYEKIKNKIVSRPVLKNEGVYKRDAPSLIAPITSRQEKIIKFLNENEKAQVVDLQTVLPKVTKRTIRRDLDQLMDLGKISRFGEYNQVFYQIRG